jgi:N4-gp56 family major capsid protein
MKELFNLQLFANPNTNTTNDNTPGNDLSPTMKTFYKTSLLENARNEHFFNQFGQKQPLPKNNGKKVEWRKFDTFAKATTPLTEGVTPDGNTVNMTKIEKEINQYGDYTTISDRLELEAVDPVIVAVTEEHGAQAGDTLEVITRNEVISGTNVILAGGNDYRYELDANDKLTPTLVDQAFTFLKKMKAPTIGGKYIGIIHPSVAYDLRESSDWIDVHKYAQPDEIFNGEIGELHGVRFVEDTEQKIWKGAGLTAGAANLSVKTNVSAATTVPVKEAISADEATALAGRAILIGTVYATIASATAGAAGSASLTTAAAVTVSADDVIYPGEAGAANAAVYATTFFGKDAYGIIEPSAESLEVIVKQRGSAGTSDPLDQRSTVGWKASHAAKILYQERLVRVESGSYYSGTDSAN